MINEYGFYRLALINSGKYSLAEVPLDDAVALQGHNNRGKTTIINSLQFLLVADKKQMSFDEYSLKDSCRFYFPSSTSYILSEVHLKTGFVVIGCVGTGLGGEYRYFAYEGTLEIDNFMLDEAGQRRIASIHELEGHMARAGRRVVFFDKHKAFRDRLFGDGEDKGASIPDFEIFPLAHRGASRETFGRILANTLRLDKLTGETLKQRLIEIYSRPQRFNLHKDWDELSGEYERNLAQYQAARSVESRVTELENAQGRLTLARGKTLFFLTTLDRLAPEWSDYRDQSLRDFETRLQAIDKKKFAIESTQGEMDDKCAKLQSTILSLKDETEECARLQADMGLVSREQVEERLRSLEKAGHKLRRQLDTAEGRSIKGLEMDIRGEEQKQTRFKRQLQAVGADLRSAISEHLSPSGSSKLFRSLSEDVLSLPADQFHLSPPDLGALVETDGDNTLSLPGLSLTLSTLPEVQAPQSREEIEEALAASVRLVAELRQALSAARDQAAAEQAINHNREETERARRALERFERMQVLSASSAQRKEELERAEAQYEKAKAERAELRRAHEHLHKEIVNIQQRTTDLEREDLSVMSGQKQVDTHRNMCGEIYRLEQLEWRDPHPYAISDLPAVIACFKDSVNDLNQADKFVDSILEEIHRSGLTRHGAHSESRDNEVKRISEANKQLDDEERAIQAEGRQLVVDFSNKLEELRAELGELERHILAFNRRINKHPVSNLEHFKVRLESISEIVDSIEILTEVARETDSVQSPLVFRDKSKGGTEKVDRAMETLLAFARKRDGIGIIDLFDLSFDFKESNEPEKRRSELEGASSRGTTLSMKIILGLTLLRLMLDDKHRIRGVCYIDEAADLDPANRETLIEVARQNGFSLILAAPEYTHYSAFRYSLAVIEHGGKRQIAKEHWKVLEKGVVADAA